MRYVHSKSSHKRTVNDLNKLFFFFFIGFSQNSPLCDSFFVQKKNGNKDIFFFSLLSPFFLLFCYFTLAPFYLKMFLLMIIR